MIQNSALGNPQSNVAPWRNAVLGAGVVGHPTFSEASRRQMDLTRKASVEMGSSPQRRFFDMGTATSPVWPGYVRVTAQVGYSDARGFGYDEPLPTVSSQMGSDPSDARFADFVAGDPNNTEAVRFRVAGLGTGEMGVFIRLGAQVSAATTVRCELRHPDRGVSSVEGTIDGASPFLATPSSGRRAYPVVEGVTSLGYGRGDLVVECLNDSTFDDAPIEVLNFSKRDP